MKWARTVVAFCDSVVEFFTSDEDVRSRPAEYGLFLLLGIASMAGLAGVLVAVAAVLVAVAAGSPRASCSVAGVLALFYAAGWARRFLHVRGRRRR